MPTTFDYLHCRCNNWETKHKAMKNVYAYNPSVCDGDYCPMDCDNCWNKDEAEEANETIAQDIQHVSYDDAQLGREK